MKQVFEKLRSWYIEPELQFRFVLSLVILIGLESVFVGQSVTKLLLMAQDWQRPNLLKDFFWTLSWLVLILVVVNALLGFYWSVRLARPIKRVERGLNDLKEGRLIPIHDMDEGDALKDLIQSFNDTILGLTPRFQRDRRLLIEVLADLEKAQGAKREDLKKILLGVRSKLSIVNAHFFKGESKKSQRDE